MTDIARPEMTKGIGNYTYWFEDVSVKAALNRIDEDGTGEAAFYYVNGKAPRLLLRSSVNMLSVRSMNEVAKRLSENIKLDWNTILTYITNTTLEDMRQGGLLRDIGNKPASMKLEYQLFPLLERYQPTTLYAPGESGKSYVCDAIAVSVQCNVAILGWLPRSGNVLYLDWEATYDDHARRVWAIKRGLGVEKEGMFKYLECQQPLTAIIGSIQQFVSDCNISLVIIDSYMAAASYGQDAAQVAAQYYNALRSLHCTTLTIDHVAKHPPLGEEIAGPYGSVAKFNRSRSQFQLEKSQEAGEDFILLALKHKKNNEGRHLKTQGIKIEFTNVGVGDEEELEKVTLSEYDLTQAPKLAKNVLLVDRIKAILRGEMTVSEITEAIGEDANPGSVKTVLNRYKEKYFIKLDGENWGRKTYEEPY